MRTLLLALLSVVAIACSGSSEPAANSAAEPAEAPPAGNTVNLDITESVIASGAFRLSGTTNIPDGATLSYRVEHDGFASGDFDGQLMGDLPVADGAFDVELDVTGWPTGHATTWISLEMRGQPAAVVEAYGANGEQLAGPNVISSGSAKRVELKIDVPIP